MAAVGDAHDILRGREDQLVHLGLHRQHRIRGRPLLYIEADHQEETDRRRRWRGSRLRIRSALEGRTRLRQTTVFTSILALAVFIYYLGTFLAIDHFSMHFECVESQYHAKNVKGLLIICMRFVSTFLLSLCIDYFFYFGLSSKPRYTFKPVGNIVLDLKQSFKAEAKTDYLKHEYFY